MDKDLYLHAIAMRKKPGHVRGAKNKIFANLLKWDFRTEAKNKVWCIDFTYIRLANGRMRYNGSILDLFDRSIVASVNGIIYQYRISKKGTKVREAAEGADSAQ